jgi:hypothetical protein
MEKELQIKLMKERQLKHDLLVDVTRLRWAIRQLGFKTQIEDLIAEVEQRESIPGYSTH